MPVLYIHGVNTRSRDGFFALKPYLQRHVAPAISDDPGGVVIDDLYWGDLAAVFAWDGESRPRSRLLGQGAEAATATGDLLANSAWEDVLKKIPFSGRPASTGTLISGSTGAAAAKVRLKDLSADEMSNYLALLLQTVISDPAQRAEVILRADDLARDPAFRTAVAAAPTPEAERELLLSRLQPPVGTVGLVGMGVRTWISDLGERLDESLRRASDLPAFAIATVAGELRRPLNDFVSVFLGDVLVYLNTRGTPASPGPIQQRLLSKLGELAANAASRTKEPLVLLSHSMGGQLVYDALTSFVPARPELSGVHVDFWCATASQVGFFEEMKLFLASRPEYRKGKPVPFPPRLGAWWNVWDYGDFVSYTVRDIVEGVDDGNFDSGMSLMAAHGGYLQCPSFYRRLAGKLEARSGRP
jgi:hypothetical protein